MGLAGLSAAINRSVFFVILVVVSCVIAPSSAMAVQSNLYSAFTRCPTNSPMMNEPANEVAACVSAQVRDGSLQLGNLGAKFNSPLDLQFALVGGGSELQVVPESTTLVGEPIVLPNPFYVPPAQGQTPPASEQPSSPKKKRSKKGKCKKPKCKTRRCKKQRHRKGKCKKGRHKGHKKNRQRQDQPSENSQQVGTPSTQTGDEAVIKVFVEAAGDLKNLDLAAVLGEPVTAFELPLKLHLQGADLGPSCYIGSESEPIVMAPKAISPPISFEVSPDPNGFSTEVIAIGGGSLEDASFSIPRAKGCGPENPESHEGALDASINALVGLPAPEGASNALFGDVLLEIAGAGYDGTPPEGGAELQAAFDAAQ